MVCTRSFSRRSASALEVLECRIAPAFTGALVGGVYRFTGSAGVDAATFTYTDATHVQVVQNSATQVFDITGASSVQILGLGDNDSVTLAGGGTFSVDLGDGNDALNLQEFTGTATADGGIGSNAINVNTDANLNVTANRVQRIQGATVTNTTFSNFSDIVASGGASANTITFDGFTGVVAVVGGGGADNITITGASFINVDAGPGDDVITATGSGTIVLRGGADNDLIAARGTAGPGAVLFILGENDSGTFTGGNDTIDISNYRGGTNGGFIDPGLGVNTLISGGATSQTLSNNVLTRTVDGITYGLTLNGTPFQMAQLIGTAGADTFNIGAFSGTGTIDGLGGTDLILNTVGLSSATVTSGSFARSSGGTFLLAGVESVNLQGTAGADVFNVSGLAGTITLNGNAGADIFNVTSDGVLALDGGNDGDTFTLSGAATGTVAGGSGNDTFNVSNLTGDVTIAGGQDVDNVVVAGNSHYRLTNSLLTRITGGTAQTFTLSGMEAATLTGGTSNNLFDLSGFTGTATLDGGGGVAVDTLRLTDDAALFTLSNTALTRTGAGSISLTGFSRVELTGGAGANTFDVSAYTRAGSVSGDGGADTVIANSGVSVASLSDSLLQRSSYGNIDLSSIENAVLGGGAENNTFALSGFTGGAQVSGGAGQNVLTVTDDVALTTLTSSQLARTGRGSVSFTGIAVVNLVGGAGDNTFDVSDYLGAGSVAGGTGVDTLVATNDVASFTLSNIALERSLAATLSLSSIEAAKLTGGVANNTFDVTGFTSAASLDGGGGQDTVKAIITTGVPLDRLVGLSDTSLTRSGYGTVSLTSIEVAQLSQTGGGNLDLRLEGWTGSGSYAGTAGITRDTVFLSSARDVVQVTGSRAAVVNNFVLTGVNVIDGGLGSAQVQLPAQVQTFSILSTGTLLGYDIVFRNVDALDGAGTNKLSQETSAVVSADGQGAPGIVVGNRRYSNFAEVRTAAVSLTAGNDEVVLTAPGEFTFGGTKFVAVSKLDGLGGADKLTINFATDADFTGESVLKLKTTTPSSFELTYQSLEAFDLPLAGSVTYTGANGSDALILGAPTGGGAGRQLTVVSNSGSSRTITSPGIFEVQQASSLFIQTLATEDQLSLDGQGSRLSLTARGADGSFLNDVVRFSGILLVTIDTAQNEDNQPDDLLRINSLQASGLASLVIQTGAGDDVVEFGGSVDSLELPALSGVLNLDLGTGHDTLRALADVSMVLSNQALQYTGNATPFAARGEITFVGERPESIFLTGGESGNRFRFADWNGGAVTINGAGGADLFDLSGGYRGGALSIFGGEGDDIFRLQQSTSKVFSGLQVAATLEGQGGRDTLEVSGDMNFLLSDTMLTQTVPKTKSSVAVSLTSTIAGLEHAVITGGVSRNVIDAGLFSGSSDLAGGGAVDNLVASKRGGELFGFQREAATKAEMKSKLYTRDNFFAPDGTVDGTVVNITATKKAFNAISFRYYESETQVGVSYRLQGKAGASTQVVSAAGVPSLTVSLTAGSGALEAVEGSSLNDKLTSAARNSLLFGLAGNDTLQANGNGFLAGGPGSDQLLGTARNKVQNGKDILPGTGADLRPAFNPMGAMIERVAALIA